MMCLQRVRQRSHCTCGLESVSQAVSAAPRAAPASASVSASASAVAAPTASCASCTPGYADSQA